MPRRTQPRYLLDDEVLHADDCLPLVEAARAGRVRFEALVRGGYPGTPLRGRALEGVRSLGFWNAPDRQDWGLDWHRNEGLELTFLSSGSLAFSTDGFDGTLGSGSLTVTRPWQPHRVGDPQVGPSHLFWLILDLDVRRPNQRWRWPGWINLTRRDLDRLTRILRQNETPVWPANRAVRDCWTRIGKVLTGEDAHQVSRLQVEISALFIELIALFESCEPALDRFLSSAERSVELFLERLGRDEALLQKCRSVEDMARLCDLSETRFHQLCQGLVNQSPGRYLNLLRIRHAQRLLLKDPERSITDIAMACGMSSSQYFATVFRQVSGESPRRWRQRHAGRRSAAIPKPSRQASMSHAQARQIPIQPAR